MFCRKCSVTGIGINEGYLIHDDWYSTEDLADEEAREMGYESFKKMYEDYSLDDNGDEISNDDVYWTTFEDNVEAYCKEQGFYYTETGELINL